MVLTHWAGGSSSVPGSMLSNSMAAAHGSNRQWAPVGLFQQAVCYANSCLMILSTIETVESGSRGGVSTEGQLWSSTVTGTSSGCCSPPCACQQCNFVQLTVALHRAASTTSHQINQTVIRPIWCAVAAAAAAGAVGCSQDQHLHCRTALHARSVVKQFSLQTLQAATQSMVSCTG